MMPPAARKRTLPERFFHAVLQILPADMRERDGAEIEALFADELDATRARGPHRLPWFLIASTWDVIRRAPHEHWRRRGRHRNEDSPMRSFLADLRFAVRSFSRQPGPTALILLTLTLGVAANTAVFAIVDGLFLRPFPFPDPGRLVYLNERAPSWNLDFTGINYGDFHTWRERASKFESMSVWGESSLNLADASGAERVTGLAVTYDFATTLGIRPLLGRVFTKEEDGPATTRVVMIGQGLWQTRFAGARDVVGRSLRLNSVPYTIVGVLPREAEFPGNTQFWIPLNEDPNQRSPSYGYEGIGRIKPGVTIEEARADLMRAHAPIWAATDSAHIVSPRLDGLREQFVSNFKAMGKALGAGSLLVLLIACANVAGAMLARSIFRRREIAIRLALGASAKRVGRQLITESLALAALAGVAGTVLGRWLVHLLMTAGRDQIPPWVQLGFDFRTVMFAVMVIVATALVFGLAPALQARRSDVTGSLVAGGSGTRASVGIPQRRMLDALVVMEIALALVLLTGSGLLVRGYMALRSTDPGFRPEGVTMFRLALPRTNYPNAVQRQFYAGLFERLSAIPGVESVGGVTCLPFGCHWGRFLRAEGAPPPSGKDGDPVVLTRYASARYFQTMGIRLVRGRFFTDNEGGPSGPHPVVINQELAKQLWPNVVDPIGKRIHWNGDTTTAHWMTVVGVVRDVKHYGLERPMIGGLYRSALEADTAQSLSALGVAIRASTSEAAVVSATRAILRQIDPELPLIEVQTAQAALNRSMASRRLIAFVFVAFGVIALALALGGIYAVLSYVVGRRRQEIGIRMALGARRGQVVSLVVRQGLRLVALGVFIGLPIALLVLRELSSLLVGVNARDPITYIAAVVLLAGTAVASALIPARRAARVDPKTALGEG